MFRLSWAYMAASSMLHLDSGGNRTEPNSVTLVACDVDGSIMGFISGGGEGTGPLGYEGELYAIYISSSLHNGRASERCWYSISYVSFVHEASVRWPCGFWPRIHLGNFMKPSEGKLSRNSRSNVGANRSQKGLTVGKI